MKSLPKLCGADIELGNFVLGREPEEDTCREAAARVLAEIDGRPPTILAPRRDGWGRTTWLAGPATAAPVAGAGAGSGRGGAASFNPQDWARRYLPANGGCAYIDMDHLELCVPEVLRAEEHVAAWHAMLRIVQQAQRRANRRLPRGEHLQLLVNNSDGYGHSYGSHLNILVTRDAWDMMHRRKVQYAMMLAAYQVSSILFTGQGKVGSETEAVWWGRQNRRRCPPEVSFQISQRADFFEQMFGTATTTRRPLVNRRDEPLCGLYGWGNQPQAGPAREMARLHVIFYDATLAPVASFLKIGVLQIIVAMIENGFLDPSLILDDPVEALHRWSRDLSLGASATTARGMRVTAIDLQRMFLDCARRYAADHDLEAVVPGHERILESWEDTLDRLAKREFDVLARRLDWVLKLAVLERTLERHPDLTWQSPEIKHLDQAYANLDPEQGLFWAYQRAGQIDEVVTREQIESFMNNPPRDTRAWARARLLRLAAPEEIEDVNWDEITFTRRNHRGEKLVRRLQMPNPLGHNEATAADWFAGAETVHDLLDRLDIAEKVEKSTSVDAGRATNHATYQRGAARSG